MTRPPLAALAIVTAMMLLALGDNFVEDVARQMSVWQYHVMRAALILPGMALVIGLTGSIARIWPQHPPAVFIRSTFNITALILYFSAIPVVGIATAAAGLFTSPVFVILISVVVFRERVGPRRWLGVALGSAGVCLVLGIGSEPLRAMALAPMLGGMFYAMNIIWTRRRCQQEYAATMAFWNMCFFVIAGTAGVLLRPVLATLVGGLDGTDFLIAPVVMPDRGIMVIIVVMGVLGAMGMVLLAWGYRSVPSTFGALFDYSFLFWAPLFAWIVRGQTIDARTTAGMVLIALAGALAITGMQQQADERG